MLRGSVAALLALPLLLLSGVSHAGPEPATHLLPATLKNVVYVRAGDSAGTGFLLRHDEAHYLVTARHVVKNSLEDPSVPVHFHIGGRHGREIREMRLLRESRRADLAIYEFDEDPRVPYFTEDAGLIPTAELHLASQVFLVGFPASLRQTYAATQLRVVGGWIAGVKKYVPGSTVEYVDIDMPGVEFGHSGGPILMLQDRVIAVAVQRRSGGISDSIAATYAVPIKYVTALIDDLPVREDVQALNETMHGTTLVCGISLHGKSDYDVWAQRVHLDTGEGVWGDMGIFVADSHSSETVFHQVPSDDGSSLIVHSSVHQGSTDHDVLVQKVSKYGELLFDDGLKSRPVASTRRVERAPAAASDGAAGAIVVYELKLDNGDTDIMAQRVSVDGELLWGPLGTAVSSAPRPERDPAVVPDGKGGAIVVFDVELEDGDVDTYAQRILPNGTLAWHEGKKSAVVAAAQVPELEPLVVSDAQGGAIVVYQLDMTDSGQRVLLAQRISAHGEMLWNGGDRGQLISSLPLAEGTHNVAVLPDGLGGAFVALEIVPNDETPGDVDLAIQRIHADGSLAWGGAEGDEIPVPVLAASSQWPERRPVLHADGQGGIIIAFQAGSAQGDFDVMAQRVDGEGKLRWHKGERSAEVAFTHLDERTPRIVEQDRNRILILFEVRGENGRGAVACQALTVSDGAPVYGGGRYPIGILDAGEADIHYLLDAPEPTAK